MWDVFPLKVKDDQQMLLARSSLTCYSSSEEEMRPALLYAKLNSTGQDGVMCPRGAGFSAPVNQHLKLWFQTGSAHSPFLLGQS